MALFWNAKYGVIENSSPSSLSDLIFKDEGLATLPISDYIGSGSVEHFSSATNTDPSEVYAVMQLIIGSQVDSFYAIPDYQPVIVGNSTRERWWNIVLTAIPSIVKNAPNTVEYMKTAVFKNFSPFMYIPKLKKVIVYDTTSNLSITNIFSVHDDGSLYGLGASASRTLGFNYMLSGVHYMFDYLVSYDNPEDLINPDLYMRVTMTAGGGNGTWFVTNSNVSKSILIKIFGENPLPPDSTGGPVNPYQPGGESGPGGGNGTFDNDSDLIEDSPLPTLSSANTGFTRIYNPTLSQVQALANYLWTDESVIETIWNHIKQYFENPMEAIIGFNLVPVPVPDGGTENFKLMYIDTGVSMTVAASQFIDVDCGTLEVPLYYGSALDYSPYTKISIFLPYIGMVSVNTDEVMGRVMQVKYRVDICSGSCVAKIFIDGNCLYQFSGHCSIPIPISAADFSTYVSSAISVGKLAGAAMLAGSGIVAPPPPITASQHTNQTTTTTTTDTARNPSTGRQITTGSQTVVQSTESSSEQSSTKASYNGLTPQSVSNTVGDVISSKPHVEHSGSFSGNSGYLGVRRPYMILQRPRMCMPGNYQQFNGFPCMMSLNLGECSGFTRVQQVHLTGLWATNPEQAEILELLKMGVVL